MKNLHAQPLDIGNPQLAKEWNYQKNGELTPRDVTIDSHIKVWWLCPYDDPKTGKHFDFEWEALISSRNSGVGCPILSGKNAWAGFNDLATTDPELAAQWNYAKNGSLTPEMVVAHSNKKVWWTYPYDDPKTGKHFDFEWEASITHRSRGRGCSVLCGKAVWPGYNDLTTTNPELAVQWNYNKNGSLTPTMVTAGCNKKVWWVFPYDDPRTGKHFDFEWKATISSRTDYDGVTCPFLTGRAVWIGFNDLNTTHPELAQQWNYDKNGKLTPYNVVARSERVVWWKYPYDDPKTGKHFVFEWKTMICNRTSKLSDTIPFLSGKLILPGFNDIKTTHPQLATEWNYKKNGTLTPEDVTAGSHRKVWWILPYDDPKTGKHFDFEWEATVSHRARGEACPYLLGRKIMQGFNDLATTNPELISEWNFEKNKPLTPYNVVAGSNIAVWWKTTIIHPITGIPETYEWKCRISTRAIYHTQCPNLYITTGELAVYNCLRSLNVTHVFQHKFKERGLLTDDFAITLNGVVVGTIEYNGQQHYFPVDFAGKGKKHAAEVLEITKRRDREKSEWLKAHGIPQLIIKYDQYDHITELVTDFLYEIGAISNAA